MSNPYQERNKLYADLQKLTEVATNADEKTLVGVRINGKDIVLVQKDDLPKLIETLKALADQALAPKPDASASDSEG